MTRNRWLIGIALGGLLAIIGAAAVTFRDWQLNPAGVFHGPGGTNWGIVWDTWISWFLPVFPISAAVALAIVWFVSRRG